MRPWALLAIGVGACGFEKQASGPNTGTDASEVAADAPRDIDAAPGAWLQGWTRRKAFTLHASKIEAPNNTALTDFPVLISVTDAQIAAGAALANGNDIVFTSSDAVTLLASDVESFSKSTNQLVAWVKVPSLSATTDTTLYVYYGNAAAQPRAPETVWTSSYLGVWHMSQDPGGGGTGNIMDASANNKDGTAQQNMVTQNLVAAQVGRGLLFDGFEDYINVPSTNLTNAFTVSMWIRYTGGGSCRALFANGGSGRDEDGLKFFVNTANVQDRRLIVESGNGQVGSGRIAETADNAVPLDAWAHVATVVDRNTATARIYINGQRVDTDSSITNDFRTTSNFNFGRMTNGFQYFPGIIDQVEVATTQRPVEWFQTSYNNQLQPAMFHTFANEEQRAANL